MRSRSEHDPSSITMRTAEDVEVRGGAVMSVRCAHEAHASRTKRVTAASRSAVYPTTCFSVYGMESGAIVFVTSCDAPGEVSFMTDPNVPQRAAGPEGPDVSISTPACGVQSGTTNIGLSSSSWRVVFGNMDTLLGTNPSPMSSMEAGAVSFGAASVCAAWAADAYMSHVAAIQVAVLKDAICMEVFRVYRGDEA
jgi:hypothetical protein